MKKLFLLAGLLSIIIFSCKKDEQCTQCDGIFSETVTMQIDNEYAPCDSLPHHCLYYQIGDTINENNWQILDQDICGFDFTPGYRYVLSVKRKKIGTNEDGTNAYLYCLERIISSKRVYL